MNSKKEIELNKSAIAYSLINHNGKNRIGVHSEFSKALNDKMKKVVDAKWSHSLKCWHIADTYENRKKCSLDNPIAVIENIKGNTKSTGKQHTQKSLLQIAALNSPQMKMFLQFLQLKAYSVSTINTYRNEFGIFLQTLGNVPADKLSTARVKDYLQYCFAILKLSENTIHSRINALKFYYEQVLKREIFF
jgi:integrase/recombinase XerD